MTITILAGHDAFKNSFFVLHVRRTVLCILTVARPWGSGEFGAKAQEYMLEFIATEGPGTEYYLSHWEAIANENGEDTETTDPEEIWCNYVVPVLSSYHKKPKNVKACVIWLANLRLFMLRSGDMP